MTSPVPAYPVGAYFVTTVTGWTGFLIALGQLLCGKPSRYMHAGIVTSSFGDTIEGQPGGARPGNLAAYAGRPVLVCDGPILEAAASPPATWLPAASMTYEAWLRTQVATAATGLLNTPYSPLDYLALAMLHLHIPAAGWVRRRVESSGHLICSALVDRALTRAGIHLFAGRLSGDVMPADLADWADDWEASHGR